MKRQFVLITTPTISYTDSQTLKPEESIVPKRYNIFGLDITSDFQFANQLIQSGIKNLHHPCEQDRSVYINGQNLTFTCQQKPPFSFDPAVFAPVYESILPDEQGAPFVTVFRTKEWDIICFSNRVHFYLRPQEIIAHLLDVSYPYLVEIYLLGTVLSFFLEREGIPMLHASAVGVDGDAVAFLSTNKGGKSGIAATLMQAGFPLLTDDILPVENIDNCFWGRPGYPAMRMWPDQATYFLGDYESLDVVFPGLDKRRIPVGAGDFGGFCTKSLPIKAIYLPERRTMPDEGDKIVIEPVSPADAVIELVRNSFIARTVEIIGWQPHRFSFFARLVQQVPMRRLIYPSGFEHLPRVRQALLRDLEQN